MKDFCKRLITLAFIVCSSHAYAAPIYNNNADILFQQALKGTTCEQVPNNGRYCTYKFGNILTIGIKDVGGSDTVVGFHNSNIKNELYAVLYFGCVVVVPGRAHVRNYSRDYEVFISPKTGLVYHTSNECRDSL